jgi:hypothetical protein
MASYYDYIDSGNYLPGDVYRAQVSRYRTPMDQADALQTLRMNQMDFDLDDNTNTGFMRGEAFGTFAALSNNPNALFASKVGQTLPKGLMNNTYSRF